jgi:hypothetical protein
MYLNEIVDALVRLGDLLKHIQTEKNNVLATSDDGGVLSDIILQQHALNNWHVEADITEMLLHLGNILNQENLSKWISGYPQIKEISKKDSSLLVKPNPNYAFAGIHEWLCCIITQTPFILTAEHNQYQIVKFLSKTMTDQNKSFESLFDISPKSNLKPAQYVIYTEEENNSVKHYFANKKALLIDRYNTVGIITGNETSDDLTNFGKDIFMHLGQSSRSLRKLFIPKSYDIKQFILALEPYSRVYQNNKYANNYDYHQSVFLMNKIPFLDNGFLIFKEDRSNRAPTGCLFYEYYNDLSKVIQEIQTVEDIENVICMNDLSIDTVKPGRSHFHHLWEYINRKDLIEFLLK